MVKARDEKIAELTRRVGALEKSELLSQRRLATVSNAVVNRDVLIKERDAAMKARDEQLLTSRSEAKRLKSEADQARKREAKEQQRAAKLEEQIAAKMALLEQIEANAEEAIEAQEADHKIALDRASDRVQQLMNELAVKASSKQEYPNYLPR
eukprot:1727949-Pleurochrysis_carterae.AAC.1